MFLHFLMRILLIGSGTREHAIGEALVRSRHAPELVVWGTHINPGLAAIARRCVVTSSITDFSSLDELVTTERPYFAVAGPDDPIGAGVADYLEQLGVPTIAPKKMSAQLESSKGFTRALLAEYDIEGNPNCMVFRVTPEVSLEKAANLVEKYMHALGGQFVVKADGLCGGKGVKVTGDHLAGIPDGLHFARKCLAADGRVVIEEKLIGEEFSAMFLTDGTTLAALPVAQDHKRAFTGDRGPNTGGMGTISDADGSLPFLAAADLAEARRITTEVLAALQKKTGEVFRGVLYGGFMATKDGVKLIEYNARFGDPEVMNVLPILETDFVDVCLAILNGKLAETPLTFARKATVVKYVVPEGYPDAPQKGAAIQLTDVPAGCRVYFGSVVRGADGQLRTGGSRALAFVGIADTLAAAEQLAEAGTRAVTGAVFHREDIGTSELLARRVQHLAELRGTASD